MNIRTLALQLLLPATLCYGCAGAPTHQPSLFEDEVGAGVEEIHVHRTVRTEHQRGATPACAAAPFPVMTDDVYELWSMETRAADSRVANSHVERVGSFRACIGALEVGRPLLMYTLFTSKDLSYTGNGECNPPRTQPPVRTVLSLNCVIDLDGLPPEYSGGVAVSNTLAPVTGTHVRGYLSTSVIVARLWRKPR